MEMDEQSGDGELQVATKGQSIDNHVEQCQSRSEEVAQVDDRQQNPVQSTPLVSRFLLLWD